MSDDLVQRVARAIAVEVRTVTESDVRAFELTREEYAALALAAIAVALEEAARVADRNAAEAWNDPNAHDTRGLMRLQADDIAAAIRALIPREDA